MGMKINFGEIEDSFEPLPEGSYSVEIARVELRESKSSEHNYLNWEMDVLDDEYEGRKLWMITSLSPKALFRLKEVFVNLGIIEEDEELELEWDDDVDITPKEGPILTVPDLQGTVALANVRNEMYNNREQNRVDALDAGDAAPSKTTKKASSGGAKKGRQRKLK